MLSLSSLSSLLVMMLFSAPFVPFAREKKRKKMHCPAKKIICQSYSQIIARLTNLRPV